MPSKKEISLLPAEENLNTFSARFLKWVTSVGRVVIVFVELIVIGAFLSRFWLDRKNSDLSETLRQQKAILASTQEFEKDYLELMDLKYKDVLIKLKGGELNDEITATMERAAAEVAAKYKVQA